MASIAGCCRAWSSVISPWPDRSWKLKHISVWIFASVFPRWRFVNTFVVGLYGKNALFRFPPDRLSDFVLPDNPQPDSDILRTKRKWDSHWRWKLCVELTSVYATLCCHQIYYSRSLHNPIYYFIFVHFLLPNKCIVFFCYDSTLNTQKNRVFNLKW